MDTEVLSVTSVSMVHCYSTLGFRNSPPFLYDTDVQVPKEFNPAFPAQPFRFCSKNNPGPPIFAKTCYTEQSAPLAFDADLFSAR
jgi:hypothetical protein